MTSNLVWLLMLVLRDILTAVRIPPQGYRYASYEVIIPRRQTLSYGQQDPQELTYLLKIEGESHMVQLRQKKDLVPKHFTVFTYNKEGDILVDYPFIRDDCFYDGLIHGRPLALVALSTCSQGLRGLLRVENKTYEIKPIQTSSTFQHVVYRLEEEEEAFHLRCGLTVEKQHHQMAMIRNVENVAKISSRGSWWTHTRYAKVAVVVEHERYVQFGRNETVVAMQLLDIIHMANSFYAPLGVHVSLVGMELWSEKNLIPIAGKLDTVLHDFNLWRQNVLAPRLEHDSSHLFIYKKFGTDLGLAYVAGMCSPEHASAVESYVTSILISFAIIFTHELGHNLGMRHDEGHCICELPNCIMAKLHTLSHKFSSCSYNDYYTEIILGRKECMKIRPDPNKLYMPKFCGNGVLEDGEECDCGSKVECESDPCCQSDCKLSSGVICAFGECCSKCQYLPVGTVCRKSTSICDLPEYCNGTSAWCPEDVYIQDGAPCQDGAHCYHGNCSTHEEQCKIIFGSKATVASEACFRELNTRGDRFGNCGITKGSDFKGCKVQDIFCGRIQCENINYLPSMEEHNSIIQTRINNRLCWGTDYHNGMRIADTGAIRDGTPCGNGMICINRECTSVSFLKFDCNITKCHNRGTCNNQKHCHCDYGSAPPYCTSKGYGGSIDSGPPPPHKAISARTIEGIVIFLCAAVCLGLCLYSKSRLMPWYRRLSGRLYPMA
ncbi:disintegrin and metalloproteinase domain-containing protein 20-like [Sphaerodactylus townsendi]|uniref:disintegrin and metalloproteinase domain-containing protein 20-like n=1 Tax=Sphaerodactylus townsendi TaxID=933632 RepID=UPI002026A9FC|nr:disintegrin and metalloproteinase domain-containing protein 20-like [Sphaerodactylus townsendi]